MARTLRYCILLLAAGAVACDDSGSGEEVIIDPPIPTPASVVVAGDSVLSISETRTYSAEVRDEDDEVLPYPVTWSVSDGALASIDASGELSTTSTGVGSLYVIATAGEARDSVELRVTQSWFAVSVGLAKTCALDINRHMWCWGTVYGTPSNSFQLLPTRVETDAQFSTVTGGYEAGCGVVNGNGAAYCWGRQDVNALGIGNANGATPQPVTGGFLFDHVALGGVHGCGLTVVHQIVCWGRNYNGQVGDSTTGSFTLGREPTLVVGGHTWKQVAAEESRSCGLTTAGKVFCWGEYVSGSAGWADSVTSHRTYPEPVGFDRTYVSIGVGDAFQCGLTEAESVECWGYSTDGRLGNGSLADEVIRTPQTVLGNHQFGQLAVGRLSACALDEENKAWCWGQNGLGDPTVVSSAVPVAVAGNHRFMQISVGAGMACGLTFGNALYCWGGGVLGNGEVLGSPTPVRVRDP